MMQTQTLMLDGHSFFLRSWGDPDLPPLLLLHGFPEFGGAWEDLAPLLAQRFHCIAPDQRGYGQSWSPEGVENYTGSKLIADMAALISHLDRGPITVMGHDWGAAVAYGLAMFRSDLVSELIIANGVHPIPFQRELARGEEQSAASQYIDFLRRPGSEDILAADGFSKLHDLFSANMDLSWLSGDKLRAYQAAWQGPERLRTMIHWYRASPLAVAKPGEPITDLPPMPADRMQVICPHLLIWGDGDTALRPETTQGLEALAPRLTRRVIPGADHWLLHTHAQDAARIILDWTSDSRT